MSPEQILVTKADGSTEPFSEEKLRESLKRAGAHGAVIDAVVKHIEGELVQKLSTSHIYNHAFSVLRNLEKPIAARYSLRRALIGFGPSGFPFEKFLAELFKAEGYTALTGQMVKGACVEHEIDVVAYNENELIMVESKFHNTPGEKSDLKVALYVKARFDDLIEQTFNYGKPRPLDEGWLVTNTKFSSKAIEYGMCTGLKMIGWNYPDKGNLQEMIEKNKLHPITCLTTLAVTEKEDLLDNGLVLCKSVRDTEALKALGFKEDKVREIREEAQLLCELT